MYYRSLTRGFGSNNILKLSVEAKNTSRDSRDIYEGILSETNYYKILKPAIVEKIGEDAFEYISSFIPELTLDYRFLAIEEPFHVKSIIQNNLSGIINIERINNQKHINKSLEIVNEKLSTNGIYIGCVESYSLRRTRLVGKMGILFYVIGPLDFISKRIIPKIRKLNSVQEFVTRGKRRAISNTEAMGRLVRAGFEMIDFKEINGLTWYVGHKVSKPRMDHKPNYGLIYKKKCMGKNGKTIFIYKFRTMHPYSEYLQTFLIKRNGYSDKGNGKIKDDFRIASWGYIFRQFFLDELPQFINLLKGDLNLVGVRPISYARLIEFPEDVVELRKKFKPGCIPPYVALLMSDELGNIEAERIYLKEKQKAPFKTDLKYFFKAVYNILTRKIVSG